ncbi:ATP/GTP-binding protein [Streptomyces xiamenensis]|uniref:AAA family ATPase n=1 Tax=Streptomyces xiamenensis TaxID=408015 RepID=UPI0035D56172
MLLRFQVTNHASLRYEQQLSLIASDEHPDRAERGVPDTRHRVLPVAAIYGPNASGKSNVLNALVWMRYAVLSSFRRWDPDGGVPRRPFTLCADPGAFPSTYEMDCVVEGTRYEFGFTVDDRQVLREWLYYFHDGHRRKLYVRSEENPVPSFGRWLTGRRKVISELLRPNSLYLSVAAAQGHDRLGALYRWFRNGLRVASDSDFVSRLNYTVDLYRRQEGSSASSVRAPLLELLRFADLGVRDLRIQEQEEGVKEEQQRIVTALREAVGGHVRVDSLPRHQVQVEHRTAEGIFSLEIDEESSGTRTWIGLLGPVLTSLQQGSVLCVDELDARLHPYLADALVGLFQSAETNPYGAQLVFSTHEASLLGHNARTELKRDQIWFTEKDTEDSTTRLFPLTDFRVRDVHDNLEKRYLSGRYGALPFLDEDVLRHLTEEVSAAGGARGAGKTTESSGGNSSGVP